MQFSGTDMRAWSLGFVIETLHGAFHIVFSKQLNKTQSGQSDMSLMSMFSQRKPHWRSQSLGLPLSTVTDLQMLSNPGNVNHCDRGKRWLMCLQTIWSYNKASEMLLILYYCISVILYWNIAVLPYKSWYGGQQTGGNYSFFWSRCTKLF